jgi:DNA modification methylase
MQLTWTTVQKTVDELLPAEYNPRQMRDDQAAQLEKSLKKFGLVEIPAINTDGTILAGHQRITVLKRLGRGKELIDVRVPNRELTDAEAKEYNLRSNKNVGEWDYDKLFAMDENLLKEVGFDDDFMDNLLGNKAEASEDDFEQPDTETLKTDIKLGDIIEIGEHRLMCGDSTNSKQVEELMNGDIADISFTSPPYNAGKNIRGNFYQNDTDDMKSDDYVSFLCDFTKNAIGFSSFSFVNIQMLESNKHAIIEYQYKNINYIKDVLIWNKSQHPPHINKGTFGTKYEYIIAFSKDAKSRGFPCSWQGKYSNVIDTENASSNKYASIHKATFPVSLPSWFMNTMDFSKSILDLFCGTGTSMVAAHQLGRKCYGMELDPKYCQVIVDRMRALDDTLTVKRNGIVI